MGWTILVLTHKGTTEKRGIELLETLWKVVEALINTRLISSLHFHNVPHRFRSGIWTGKAIMDLKLAQELARVYHYPIFLVLLDLQKSYDTVDTECLIQTLEG